MNRRLPPAALLFLLLLGLLLLAGGCAERPEPRSSDDGFLNQDLAVAYVGIDECRECHLGIAATYTQTGMGRSFYPLATAPVVEDWDTNNEFVSDLGVHYRMSRRDGRFFQRQFLRDSQGHETAVDERELVWVVGSNHHNRTYVVEVDGRLFQAPVCWYPEISRWEFCPGYELKNDHFSREISASCVFCHNGVMPLVDGERNLYEEPIPHGIGCERCHGPGQLHVERWSVGRESARGDADPTIVNPRRLSHGQRMSLCFQCHLGDSKATERIQRQGRELDEFRPGQSLTAVAVPFRFVEPTQHDFGLSAQGDRLIRSRCYLESDGALDCLTCHNPHISVYHDERPADFFRRKCLGCHAREDCGKVHGNRETAELPDDCVACHMRKGEPDDQRFSSFTDHWIRRRIDVVQRGALASLEIEPVIPPEPGNLSAGESAYYRARADYLIGEDLPPRAREAMWARAIAGFERAAALGFDTAKTRFYLGKTYMHQGRWSEAERELRAARQRDPRHRDAGFALGQVLAFAGDAERARRTFEELLAAQADEPMVLAELGRAQWTLGLFEEALGSYRRALELEPWNADLHQNHAAALASLGRYQEALESSRSAAVLDPDSPDIWNFISNAAREAGRIDDSREAESIRRRLAGG